MAYVRSRPRSKSSNWTDQYALHLIKKIPSFTINHDDPEEAYKSVTIKRLQNQGYVKVIGYMGSKGDIELLGLTEKGTRVYQQLRTQGKAYVDEMIHNPIFSLTSKGRVPSKYTYFWDWLYEAAPEHYPAVKSLGEWLNISNVTFLTIFTEMNASTVISELEEFYESHKVKCDDLLERVPLEKMQELHELFLSLEHNNYNYVSSLSTGFVKARYVLQVGREAEAIWKSYTKWNDHAHPLVTAWKI